ncbi:MAG TPA: hypothetical protein VN849_12945 [Stellaceae bacterium]|jgi:hypothetical protein|nr:hypothetical protein [Stellaceae bacterium]
MSDIRCGLSAALFASLLTTMPALAAEPDAAGIVMSVTGQTTPDLPIRTEIPADTEIKLGPGVELTFLHYRKCKLVTVAGGTLELSARDFTTDGKVESEKPGPCPRVYQLAGSAGGWVARDLPPRLPVNPEIIFAGRRADRIAEAAVYAPDQRERPLFRFDLVDRRATEPAAAEMLTAEHRYVLSMKMSDQPNPIEHGFVAVAPGTGGSLVVLRID